MCQLKIVYLRRVQILKEVLKLVVTASWRGRYTILNLLNIKIFKYFSKFKLTPHFKLLYIFTTFSLWFEHKNLNNMFTYRKPSQCSTIKIFPYFNYVRLKKNYIFYTLRLITLNNSNLIRYHSKFIYVSFVKHITEN